MFQVAFRIGVVQANEWYQKNEKQNVVKRALN